MNLQNDAVISLSNADFQDLVAGALNASVLYCPGGSIRVNHVQPDEADERWEINFHISEDTA